MRNFDFQNQQCGGNGEYGVTECLDAVQFLIRFCEFGRARPCVEPAASYEPFLRPALGIPRKMDDQTFRSKVFTARLPRQSNVSPRQAVFQGTGPPATSAFISLPRHSVVPCLLMPISQARTIAFDVLLRVAKQNAYADDVLRAELDGTVKTEDAGLATELALGVLRWQRLLDFVIDRYLKKPANTADVEVRIALRLGVYQLLFLDRVPAHAAVHESVELVKRARKRSAATLVNAILRKAAKEPFPGNSPADAVAPLIPADLPLADRLGIQYSHPTWMVERWLRILWRGADAQPASGKQSRPRSFRVPARPATARGFELVASTGWMPHPAGTIAARRLGFGRRKPGCERSCPARLGSDPG